MDMKNSKFNNFTKKTFFYSSQFLFLPISIKTSFVLLPISIFLIHNEFIGFGSDDFFEKYFNKPSSKMVNEKQSQRIYEQIKNEYYEYCVKYKKPNYLYHDLPNYFYAKS